ncbi:hypothetical protein HGP29_20395 [Flammeovirga sp. SR4]|uniref:Uncharacterized protein n=1 Tax=Flammeovirga agarivorans TaxID=2726742 RepID=A0A7X8SNP0_9BACT|nr:hypothetical protein [Flammeovirga agarivorans]
MFWSVNNIKRLLQKLKNKKRETNASLRNSNI